MNVTVGYFWTALFLLPLLVSCTYIPPPTEPAKSANVSTRVFFYPKSGQSLAQQDRDQYDCYLWAMKKTDYDPSIPPSDGQHEFVQPYVDPNHDTASGMATGAVIGSMVAPRHRSAEGAIVGAMIGAIIGSASDAERNQQMAQVNERQRQKVYAEDERAREYKRAMTACLEGRGYEVK